MSSLAHDLMILRRPSATLPSFSNLRCCNTQVPCHLPLRIKDVVTTKCHVILHLLFKDVATTNAMSSLSRIKNVVTTRVHEVKFSQLPLPRQPYLQRPKPANLGILTLVHLSPIYHACHDSHLSRDYNACKTSNQKWHVARHIAPMHLHLLLPPFLNRALGQPLMVAPTSQTLRRALFCLKIHRKPL